MSPEKQAFEELREMYLRGGLNPADIRKSELEARTLAVKFRSHSPEQANSDEHSSAST